MESNGVISAILVGLFVTIVGGLAVWAITERETGGNSTPTTQSPGESADSGGGDEEDSEPSTGGTTDSEGSANEGGSSRTPDDCTITVTNPLVRLMEQPDTFGLEVGQLPTGSYSVLEVRLVTFVDAQRWYLIDSSIGQGWVQDNSILVESKSGDCS